MHALVIEPQTSGQPRSAFSKLRIDEQDNVIEGAAHWDYDFQCYFLYQPRPDLYQKIDLRCEQMVQGRILNLLSLFVVPHRGFFIL